MSPEENVSTVTFRIPLPLKETLEAVSAASGETATAIMRTALEQFFGSKDRVHELTGFRPEFSEFLKDMKKVGPAHIALLSLGRDGKGYVYDGQIDFNYTNESIVALRGEAPILIPRAFIVGWNGDGRLTKKFVMAATRGGWTSATPRSYG